MTLQQEIAAYEAYIGKRINWLERLGDASGCPVRFCKRKLKE